MLVQFWFKFGATFYRAMIYGGVILNFTFYIPIIFLFIIIYVFHKRRQTLVVRRIIERKRTGGYTEMKELAQRFINKDCVIYSFDGGRQFIGVIKEVTDGAILVEKDGKIEAINLDFVIRIREYPTNKNGKKKSVILD